MRRVLREYTGFQPVEIWASSHEAEIRVAGAVHAWWGRDRLLTGLAWDNLAAACLLRPAGPPTSVLLLGVAGATTLRILRHLLPDAHLMGVEIDPGLTALAQRYLHLEELGLELHHADAYEWIQTWAGPPFDVIIDDVYQALPHDVVRPGVYSESTAVALHRLLAPDGLMIVNLVTGTGHRAVQSTFRRYFRDAFPVSSSVTTPGSMNEALVGGEAVLTSRALRPWRSHFPHPYDLSYWDLLRVRKMH